MFGLPISPKIYFALAVMLLIAVLGGGTYYYHGKYQGEVTTNIVLQTQNDQLIAQIKADSVAVEKLKTDSDARSAAAETALAASQRQLQDYTKKAQALLLAAAQTPTDMCASANFLFNDYISGAK